jgi:hypothetical protein
VPITSTSKPRTPTLADLLQGVRDAVHLADAVGNQRDARAVAVAARQLGLLASEEGAGGRIWNRRNAGVKYHQSPASDVDPAGLGHRHDPPDRGRELTLVDGPRAALEIGMAEVSVLEHCDQAALVDPEVHRNQPRAQQRDRVARPEVGTGGAVAHLAFLEHALDDLEHRRRVGARRRVAVSQRPDRERHRGVSPLRGTALGSAGGRRAGADVRQELGRRGGDGRLGERPPDIDSGVVIGPADGGPPVGLDVNERRQVQLLRP